MYVYIFRHTIGLELIIVNIYWVDYIYSIIQ